MLIQHFLKKHCDRYQMPVSSLSDEAVELLAQYNWPGNVRQLENVIENVIVLSRSNQIGAEDLPPQVRQTRSRVSSISLKVPDEGIDLEQVEKEILVQALERHHWNQTRAAGFLNISRKTLIYRMEKFGLAPSSSNTTSAVPSVET